MFVLLAGAVLAACSSAPTPTATAGPVGPAEPGAQVASVKAATLRDIVSSDPALAGKTGRPQVVEFFAYWCTECQRMHPVMEDLKAEFSAAVDFLYYDIDAANTKDLQRQLTFSGLRPTIILLDKDGKEVRRFVGVHPKETIQVALDNLVAVG